jgi:peroxiredoxin
MAEQLKVGDKALDFELLPQTGNKVKLSSFRKRR